MFTFFERLINKRKKNKGQIVMEAAFCLPVIMLLFFFIFDASRILIAKQDLMQAARNSIRYLSIQEPSKAAQATVSGTFAKYLILNTATKGTIKEPSDVKLNGLNVFAGNDYSVQSAQGSPILTYGCVKVKVLFPLVWHADNSGKVKLCHGYYMERTMTETKAN